MEYQNILIIKMSSLGDVLHTLPFVAALRKRFPHARLTWLVHPQFGGFVPDPPLVDEVLYWDKAAFGKLGIGGKLGVLKALRAQLRARHFDLVIDMQGLAKSALMALLSGCPNRIGYAEMREGSGLVSKAISGAHRQDHVIERYLDVARYLGCEINDIEFPLPDLSAEWQQVLAKAPLLGASAGAGGAGDAALSAQAASGGSGSAYTTTVSAQAATESDGGRVSREAAPYVVLVPGARWDTKRWPTVQFAQLARMLLRDGKHVVLAGGKEDIPLGREIVQLVETAAKVAGTPQDASENTTDTSSPADTENASTGAPGALVDLTGQTSLRELGALIQHAEGYISADTGPLFIATALKKPLVALYGPTQAERTGPYGSERSHVLLTPADCAGCLQKHCDHWHCMTDITPARVYEAYQEMLAKGGTQHGA